MARQTDWAAMSIPIALNRLIRGSRECGTVSPFQMVTGRGQTRAATIGFNVGDILRRLDSLPATASGPQASSDYRIKKITGLKGVEGMFFGLRTLVLCRYAR